MLNIDFVISHLSSMIDRHAEEISELEGMKPKPIPSLVKTRNSMRNLQSIRAELKAGRPCNITSILEDMKSLGWA